MAERLKDSWVLGSPRDPDRKISPYLVPWQELTEEVKGRDRNLVWQISELLGLEGFEIYSLLWVCKKLLSMACNLSAS